LIDVAVEMTVGDPVEDACQIAERIDVVGFTTLAKGRVNSRRHILAAMAAGHVILLENREGRTVIAKANLFYFVQTENLVYRDDATRKWIYVKAVSGGGRGQRVNNIPHPHGVNDSRLFTSLSEREKHIGNHRGGPIPRGTYSVGIPCMNNFGTAAQPHMVMSCVLKPTGQAMYQRDNFFIHGQGSVGSDGCVVPTHGKVHEIFHLVKKHHGAWMIVETAERHGVDYERQWASKGARLA